MDDATDALIDPRRLAYELVNTYREGLQQSEMDEYGLESGEEGDSFFSISASNEVCCAITLFQISREGFNLI